jgi:hypothetical protein
VIEEIAKEMMKNPETEKEFVVWLKSNPEKAKNPQDRLQFFYRKHPSFDRNFGRYPIFKL